MNDFTFQCATKILFGRGREKEVGPQIVAEGHKKVLLHYGGSHAEKSGLLDRVRASLREAGVAFVELGGVAPNPRVRLVNEGVALCRREGVELILAVGGGSVIDSAKCMGFAVFYEGDAWDFLTGKAKAEKTLPVATVLTIPAAGSEASDSCVISNDATLEKRGFGHPAMRPVFSILNPELTMSLPPYQTACGAMDIMAHVMERYFSPTPHVELTDRLSEGILRTVIHNLPIVLREPEHYDARAEIMWAGTLGQNDMTGTGRAQDWANHVIEHALSARYDVTHGAGLAVTFCAWMEEMVAGHVEKFAQYAIRVWGVEMNLDDPLETARMGVAAFRRFVRDCGLPTTLSELGIPKESIGELADIAAEGGKPLGAFSRLDRTGVVRLLERAAQ